MQGSPHGKRGVSKHEGEVGIGELSNEAGILTKFCEANQIAGSCRMTQRGVPVPHPKVTGGGSLARCSANDLLSKPVLASILAQSSVPDLESDTPSYQRRFQF